VGAHSWIRLEFASGLGWIPAFAEMTSTEKQAL